MLDLAAADLVVRSLLPGAGRIALEYFRTGAVADDKRTGGRYDPVTEADRGVEAHLRAGIAAAFPDHRIVGEEGGTSGPADATAWWSLDPIDGTRAFVTGMPAWGTLIGLVDGDDPVAGWVHQPFTGETFSAVAGQARYERAGEDGLRPMRTSGCTALGDASLYTTHPSMFPPDAGGEAYGRLAEGVRMQRFGGDCYAYCLLALGEVDLVVEAGLQHYDIVPLIPLIEAAGGIVTDLDGRRPLGGGTVVAAATRPLHAAALARLQEDPAR